MHVHVRFEVARRRERLGAQSTFVRLLLLKKRKKKGKRSQYLVFYYSSLIGVGSAKRESFVGRVDVMSHSVHHQGRWEEEGGLAHMADGLSRN